MSKLIEALNRLQSLNDEDPLPPLVPRNLPTMQSPHPLPFLCPALR